MLTPPAQFYIDPARLRTERERIFARSWQIVGHINDAPKAGDYVTRDFLGERVVTERGADGVQRTFNNV